MATTQQSNIQSWRTALNGKIHPTAVSAINLLFDAIQDHDTAIVAVNSKITTPATTPATVVPSTPSSSSSSTLGLVNVQTGTTYATQITDNGGLLVLNNAAPVAVTLTATVQAPWFMSVVNLGSANAVFSPSSGTINNVSTLTLGPNGGAFIYFDGTNFWAPFIPIVPATKTVVAHQWLASYDASTGIFVSSQPGFSDISGTATAAQVPVLSALTGQITTGQLPASGLSVTVTTAALTTGGTQGSQTFLNGILTAQVQAT